MANTMIAFKVDGKLIKAKVKKVSTFFGQELATVKNGVVCADISTNLFPSREAAEEAVITAIKVRNSAWATWASAVPNCIDRIRAHEIKALWDDGDNSPITWGVKGGEAVAVKLDSLGKAVDYLSLADWAARGWNLPEGNWSFFNRSL